MSRSVDHQPSTPQNRSGSNRISLTWIIILIMVIVGGGGLFLSRVLSPGADPAAGAMGVFLTEVPQNTSTLEPTITPTPTIMRTPTAFPTYTPSPTITPTLIRATVTTTPFSTYTPSPIKGTITTTPLPTMTAPAFGLTDYGIQVLSQGDYDYAIDLFSMALDADGDYIDAYYHRGLAYHALEDYESAIKDFKSVLKIYSVHVDSYAGLGNAYYELEQFDLALENYETYLELADDSADQSIVERVEELHGD